MYFNSRQKDLHVTGTCLPVWLLMGEDEEGCGGLGVGGRAGRPFRILLLLQWIIHPISYTDKNWGGEINISDFLSVERRGTGDVASFNKDQKYDHCFLLFSFPFKMLGFSNVISLPWRPIQRRNCKIRFAVSQAPWAHPLSLPSLDFSNLWGGEWVPES